MADGKFWLHEIIRSCYQGANNPAWNAVRQLITDMDERGCNPESDIRSFIDMELGHLEMYNAS